MKEKHEYLLAEVQRWLGEQGYRQAKAAHKQSDLYVIDAVFRKRNAPTVFVEAKVVDVYRSQVFPAVVGDAILRAGHDPSDGDILLAFLMRRMSSKAESDLRKYANKFMPDLNWFLLDEHGSGIVNFHGRSENVSSNKAIKSQSGKHGKPSGVDMFSPNNQWLLKVLLLAGIDGKYWGGPHQLPNSIAKLASASQVPQPSVSKFVARFEEAGFLRRSENRFVVLRHRELLSDWFHARKHDRRREIGVRPLYGKEPDERFLDKIRQYCVENQDAGKEPPVILGHHLACHLMGVGRSNVRSVKLYANRPIQEVMSALDLVSDDSAAPKMIVYAPPVSKAVVRGLVVSDGIPICDILQCYLDIRSSRARGEEQVRFILDRIFMPHFHRNA